MNKTAQRTAETPLQAFLIGRADRTSGRPITCIYGLVDGNLYDDENWDFWSSKAGVEFNHAYYAGYDPNNDLALVMPEYVETSAALARRLFEESGLPFPAPNEPVSVCERSTEPQRGM